MALRSADPLGSYALSEVGQLFHHFWEHGTTDQDAKLIQSATDANPLFSTAPDSTSILHYALDPLLGFHLALGLASLSQTGHGTLNPVSDGKGLVKAAKAEFKQWCGTFRDRTGRSHPGCTLRFFVGDALSFCVTLKSIRNQGHLDFKGPSSTLPGLPLPTLDGAYFSAAGPPVQFDVIDSSNLADHLGLLNVLASGSGLLKSVPTSTLWTELLVQQGGSRAQTLESLLCGPVSTVPLLFGLCAPEYWTNTSTCLTEELAIKHAHYIIHGATIRPGQLHSRVAWRCAEVMGSSMDGKFNMDDAKLARLLYEMYKNISMHESVDKILPITPSHYHCGSFAVFVRNAMVHVRCDWSQCLRTLLNLVESYERDFPGGSCLHELSLHLRLLGMHPAAALEPVRNLIGQGLPDMRQSHAGLPLVAQVALVVPRSALQFLSAMNPWHIGTPNLLCSVVSPPSAAWEGCAYTFAALQLCFGTIELQERKHFGLSDFCVRKDVKGWTGSSDLIVSFLAPGRILRPEAAGARIVLRIEPTPATGATFMPKLGLVLALFETTLDQHESVYLRTLQTPPMRESTALNQSPSSHGHPLGSDFSTSVSLELQGTPSRITTMRARIDFVSDAVRIFLQDKAAVKVVAKDLLTLTLSLSLGSARSHCDIKTGIPVSSQGLQLKIVRTSGYVEIIAIAGDQSSDGRTASSMFHLLSLEDPQPSVALWNLSRIDLDRSPLLDLSKPSRLEWLTTHAFLMFSPRERALREKGMAGLADPEDQTRRVDYKDGMFSMLMSLSGLQGTQSGLFALCNPEAGGVEVLIFANGIRLDLGCRAAVIDAGVMPLTYESMAIDRRVQQFLGSLVVPGTMFLIKVSDAELRLWKENLRCFAERCRTWAHVPEKCDFLTQADEFRSHGLADGASPLCSCGVGELPSESFNGKKWQLPHADHVFRKYTTRVAIPLCYPVPFVEDCVPPDPAGWNDDDGDGQDQDANLAALLERLGLSSNHPATPDAKKAQCDGCGRKEEDSTTGGKSFPRCARCGCVKYCSRECQKKRWRVHKTNCNSATRST
jgi:hypothetical protein